MEAMSMNWSNYNVIYPTYLDSSKTIKLGRRIPANEAVDQPTVQEIGEALRSLRVRHVVQPFKGYSRDTESRWDNPGRVLVDMKGELVPDLMSLGNSDGLKMKTKIDTKIQLLKEIAKIIPDLEIRTRRLEQKKIQEKEKEKQKQILAKTSSMNTGNTSSKKRKGKKKR